MSDDPTSSDIPMGITFVLDPATNVRHLLRWRAGATIHANCGAVFPSFYRAVSDSSDACAACMDAADAAVTS